jgi:hypothetical protein
MIVPQHSVRTIAEPLGDFVEIRRYVLVEDPLEFIALHL